MKNLSSVIQSEAKNSKWATNLYKNFLLKQTIKTNFNVVLDCANGSASAFAKTVFSKICNAKYICCTPNGKNINNKCGATYLPKLQEAVVKQKCDVGFAFDGDADRCIAVDNEGTVVDGDGLMYIIAKHLKASGNLKGNAVVGTVMSNLGLERALESEGIRLVREKVGDKYVYDRLQKDGLNFGGEQAGHLIFLDKLPTGCGLFAAITILNIMSESGQSLKQLANKMQKFPQVTINVTADEQQKLNAKNTRILLRPSGTEPYIRVMVEGKDEKFVRKAAEGLAELLTNLNNGL